MDSDFNRIWDGFRVESLDFDLNNFTSKNIVSLKYNIFWRVHFLVKLLRAWM